MKYWNCIWRLACFRPWTYLSTFGLRLVAFPIYIQIVGQLFQAFFDTLSGHASVGINIWSLMALMVACSLVRVTITFADIFLEATAIGMVAILLRKNVFEYLLEYTGARTFSTSPSEAISHFRDDVEQITALMSNLIFLFSFIVLGIVALVVMSRINILITLVVFFPLAAIIVVMQIARRRIVRYRKSSRVATAKITNFLGEIFGVVQAVKVAGTEDSVIGHFEELNNIRRQAMLKETVFNTSLNALFLNTTNLGIGIVLMIAGQSMSHGSFTMGDFALFVYYLGFLTDLINRIGQTYTAFQQAEVSFERIETLLYDAPAGTLVLHSPLAMRGPLPANPFIEKEEQHHLHRLEVRGLSYVYPGTSQGIYDINFCLSRGSFTVIVGRTGSGKTTLLRVLLGLSSKDAGEIFWNDQIVAHPTSFFVPPRSAYTSQVPVLFSETLKENILLGLPEEKVKLADAMRLAVLEQDVESMKGGLDTLIGRRGVEISGGQQQRTAAARMFVRVPELYVFDDLSSALDVETEHTLWEQFLVSSGSDNKPTCLVASHRRAALLRATRIIVLENGRVEAEGTLKELLETNELMRHLWQTETILESSKNSNASTTKRM